MPHALRHFIPLFITLGLVPILAGCPPRPATTLNASPATLNFTLADVSKEFGIDIANGSLDWTVADNQPWITVAPASGSNDGAVTVTVDRAQMNTAQANSGVVTVTAGTLTDTVNITVPAAPPAEEIADQLAEDLAAADANDDNQLSFEEALTVLPGLTQPLFDVIDTNDDGLLSNRELAAGGEDGDLTPIDTAYFPMDEGNSWTYAFGAYGNDLGADSLRLTVADQLDVAGTEVWQVDLSLPGFATGIPVFKGLGVDDLTGDNPAVSTYWVFVDGTWYAALSLESLDALPDTSMLLPIGELLRWPTSLAYLQSSGLLESAYNEIVGIVAIASLYLEENEEAIYNYLYALSSGDTEAAFALFLAFGNNFDGYESGDPLANAQVQLLADLGIGLGPISIFFQNFGLILEEMSFELGQIEEMPISLPFWTAWEGDFGSTYTNADPVVEASVRLVTQIAYELSVQYDEQETYTEDEIQAYNEYLYALFETIDANAGLLAGDPAGFVDALQEFATNYESDSAAVESAVGATLRILDAADALLPALEGHMPFPLDLAGLSTFLGEGIAFTSAYTDENGADPAAALVSILLGGLQDIVDELEVVAPTLNTLAADLETLETLASTTLIPSFDFKVYAGVFADFETFFNAYGETESDALAGALGAMSGAASGSLDVLAGLADEVAAVPYEELSGNLESLLPAIPDFPFNRTLADFGIADQADCVAPGIEFDLESDLYKLSSTIYAKDLGPAMFFFLPLQYAVIDGEFTGTISTAEIARQLGENFEAADVNADGRLTWEEAQAAIPGITEAAFAEINGDSVDDWLTIEEVLYFGTNADAYEPDDTMEEASPIATGETQSHTFHQYYDVDWVVVEVTDQVEIALDVATVSGDIYFYLDLYDSDGNWLDSTSDYYGARLSQTFYTPGFYFVRVSTDYVDETTDNNYTLNLEETPAPQPDNFEVDDSPEEANPIATDEVQNRSFHVMPDQDWVSIEVTDPTTLTLRGESETGELYIYIDLYDASNNWLASASGYFSELSYTFDTPGTYYALISTDYIDEFTGNAYTLSLEQAATPEPDSFEVDDSLEEANPIAIDEAQSRTFHLMSDQDWVAIEVTDPTTLSLRGESETGELYVYIDLYDASNNWLASASDYFPELSYTFDTPGTYYALISTDYIDEFTGNAYSLWLEELPPPVLDSFEVDDSLEQASSIAVGDTQSRSFHVSDDQDWVAIEITEATTLTIATQNLTGDLDTTLTLFDSEMNELAYNDDDQGLESRIDYTFDTPGTYYLLAAPLGSANPGATYELTLAESN